MRNIISAVDNYSKITDFYPDDIPEDWRLDYYLNEFDALFLDAKVAKVIEDNDEDLDEVLDERETPINIVIENKAFEVGIKEKTSLITHYCITDKSVIKHNISKNNNQGVDDLRVIWVDFSDYENIKKLSEFCQTTITKEQTTQTICLIKTPCSIKQLNDFEILLNLIF